VSRGKCRSFFEKVGPASSARIASVLMMRKSPDSRVLSPGLRGGHSPARRLSCLTTNGNRHKHPDQRCLGRGRDANEVRECPSHQRKTIIANSPMRFSPPYVQLHEQRSQGIYSDPTWTNNANQAPLDPPHRSLGQDGVPDQSY
jgi:hypothetical protein